ncbi:hypothetical protein K488DRAFT_85924 [Vararia minispora EC-137]|uniref:Uncharacterized protein n=1 Tax=Vararia minispora EC-137 TaxID=1314806 RepID=A0ACB8QKM5_9AGAM|nr:hypothetical protein K488DRAFT_85924 [Vararia minispora EC-137]
MDHIFILAAALVLAIGAARMTRFLFTCGPFHEDKYSTDVQPLTTIPLSTVANSSR